MAALRAGQTAYLRAGIYREATDTSCGPSFNALSWRRSGRRSAPITISGFRGEEKDVLVRTKINVRGDYLRLTRLVIEGNTSHSSFDEICNGSVNVAVYGDDVELSRLEVRGARMSGIYVSGADRLRVVRNWIHDNGTHRDKDHGIYVGSSQSALIANNVFDRNLAYGIHLYPDPNDDARVLHNTVVGHGRSGLVLSGRSSRDVIANNIFAFNADYGLREFKLAGSSNIATQNLLYGNGRGPVFLPDEQLTVSGSILRDPRFVDRNGRNYRLRAGSPGLGRATPRYRVVRDYDGRLRPRRARADLGAFER